MKHQRIALPNTDAVQEMAESCGQSVVGCASVAGIVAGVRDRMQQLGEKRSYLEAIAHSLANEQEQVVAATDTARQLSRNARRHLEDSSETIRQSITELHGLIALILGLGEDVGRFASAMDEVVRASQTIDSIARSTNMLALNAAIEAERAGPAGATFAVVAAEVKKLAQDTRSATDRIALTMDSLSKEAQRFMAQVEHGAEQSRSAQRHFETISQSITEAGKLVGEVDQRTEEIADSSTGVRANTKTLCDNLFVFMGDVARCDGELQTALGETNALADETNAMFNRLLHSGLSQPDNPYVAAALDGCATIRSVIEQALESGDLSMEALFDHDYRPRGEHGLERYDTRFNAFADARIRPLLDRLSTSDPAVYGAVITNEDGYLPTHISKRCQPPTGDLEHDRLHCRNRLKLMDKTTTEAVKRRHERFYAAVYRFSPESGANQILRNIFVPLWINGRYWGNFELAYVL